MAAALNEVQSSAVDLAVEQAVLRRNISDSYINLGRRNQNLLSRQLDFITDLERNETDPDTLEGLFRLDHLATRMRRNAESLLVLAGIEPPRTVVGPGRHAPTSCGPPSARSRTTSAASSATSSRASVTGARRRRHRPRARRAASRTACRSRRPTSRSR